MSCQKSTLRFTLLDMSFVCVIESDKKKHKLYCNIIYFQWRRREMQGKKVREAEDKGMGGGRFWPPCLLPQFLTCLVSPGRYQMEPCTSFFPFIFRGDMRHFCSQGTINYCGPKKTQQYCLFVTLMSERLRLNDKVLSLLVNAIIWMVCSEYFDQCAYIYMNAHWIWALR